MNNPEGLPLLPCPFCGKAGVKISFTLSGCCYVGCQQVGCCGEGGDDGVLAFDSEAEAVAAWNRRVVPASPVAPAEREGLVLEATEAKGSDSEFERGWSSGIFHALIKLHPQHPLLRRADEFAKVGAVVPIDMVTTSKMARLIADLAAALRGAAPPTDKNLGG
jgi:hypothetical protein